MQQQEIPILNWQIKLKEWHDFTTSFFPPDNAITTDQQSSRVCGRENTHPSYREHSSRSRRAGGRRGRASAGLAKARPRDPSAPLGSRLTQR